MDEDVFERLVLRGPDRTESPPKADAPINIKLGEVDSIYGAATLTFTRSPEGKPLLHFFSYYPQDRRRASNLLILSEFAVSDLKAALDKFEELKKLPHNFSSEPSSLANKIRDEERKDIVAQEVKKPGL